MIPARKISNSNSDAFMNKNSTSFSHTISNPVKNGAERNSPRGRQTPTTAELRTAIEVLTQLGERMSIESTHSVLQLPQTQLGAYYAESIEQRAIEHALRIKAVSAQLENWCDDLAGQQPGNIPVNHVEQTPGFVVPLRKLWSRMKNLAAAKISPQKMIPKTLL
jgi:hypothetical protein